MVGENLARLRVANGISQEKAAEVAGVSRQAYARWERGETVPDVERCARLAQFFGTSVDAMVGHERPPARDDVLNAPAGKHIWGTVTVGERGQIVIPKAARETFDLAAGSRLVVLGDEAEGIALVKAERFEDRLNQMLRVARTPGQ